jgi:hypothetical protein
MGGGGGKRTDRGGNHVGGGQVRDVNRASESVANNPAWPLSSPIVEGNPDEMGGISSKRTIAGRDFSHGSFACETTCRFET